ncbi:MAG TPA: FAD-dependent oxidoreductase, partial [Candidatus Eisenbacteria bacterium]|nr:FAD-dependent oxidoreductase [Candidatus Eisenbacteria bacterium]
MSLPSRAAVVVIGGGVIGASVAHHLAQRGVRDVVVLDRADGPGLGSTGKATGGFRAQYGTAINVRLSLLSREKLMRFEEETGFDPGYEQAGYLWMATTDAALETLRAGNRMQRDEGLAEAVMVSPEDIARINPALALDGVVGGAFCPTDGFIKPLEMLRGYRAAAERAGVRFEWGVEVRALARDSKGRLRGVESSAGVIETDAV